ncbi:hypothetical protein FNV43_RR08136 [Rhamnella rubrinervis]|uniref:DUF4220 domain-containing protein n=1 Tax=Rhamnella rubrinervis TaxID=2594499 RepID=A0A8K0HHX0_9ROSA|nr:hypothetical protein FNV43_RR08136 [Rhamnella rubrinervis]
MGVGIQIPLVIYMFFTYFSPPSTRPGDPLPFVAIPVFITGNIKCVDRSWSLWSPRVNLNFNKDLSPSFTTPGSPSISCYGNFRMVELEMGLLYDVLYTKIPIIQSTWGRILLIISFFCSISALVAFSVIINRPPYSMLNRFDLDVSLTYLLLVGSVILEIYCFFFFVHIFSTWTLLWLSRDKDNTLFISFYDFISLLMSIPSRILGRESTMFMAQHSATAKRFGCMKLFLLFHDKLGRYLFTTLAKADGNLKESIFTYLNDQRMYYGFCSFLYDTRDEILEKRGYEAIRPRYGEFSWSINVEFDHSILPWHIATEKVYRFEKNRRNEISEECKRSKLISDYMFYLLLTRPTMMAQGISDLRTRDTCNEMVQVLERPEKKGMSLEKDLKEMFENGGTRQDD